MRLFEYLFVCCVGNGSVICLWCAMTMCVHVGKRLLASWQIGVWDLIEKHLDFCFFFSVSVINILVWQFLRKAVCGQKKYFCILIFDNCCLHDSLS